VPHRKSKNSGVMLAELARVEVREPHLRPVCHLLRELINQGRMGSASGIRLLTYIIDALPAEEAAAWRGLLPGRRIDAQGV
jgi:hypothetical protein